MIKVHFGCGRNVLQGWKNLDLPETDVTEKLPFLDNYVDYIFHEHLLEHLDQVDGISFLSDCYRILKNGGTMRICCPSIDGFFHVYQNWDNIKNEKWKKYRHQNNKNYFINNVIYGEAAYYQGKRIKDGEIVNIKNSDVWHKYLWDKEELTRVLREIGFKKIAVCEKLTSEDKNLINLERRAKAIKVTEDLYFTDFPKELDLVIEASK